MIIAAVEKLDAALEQDPNRKSSVSDIEMLPTYDKPNGAKSAEDLPVYSSLQSGHDHQVTPDEQ